MKITRAVSDNNDKNVPKYNRKPFNDHQWIYLAQRLIEFAELESSLFIDVFPLSWGYSPYKFKKKWFSENETFAEALELATAMINQRRNQMLTFSKEIVDRKDWLDRRPLYDKEYLEYLKEKDAVKNDAIKGSVTVQVMPIPNSDIVKPIVLKETEQGEQKTHVTVIIPERKKDETRTS